MCAQSPVVIIFYLLSTVRVWKSGCGSEVIEAHKPAVWTIAGLFAFDGTKRILTGNAKLGRKAFLSRYQLKIDSPLAITD